MLLFECWQKTTDKRNHYFLISAITSDQGLKVNFCSLLSRNTLKVFKLHGVANIVGSKPFSFPQG